MQSLRTANVGRCLVTGGYGVKCHGTGRAIPPSMQANTTIRGLTRVTNKHLALAAGLARSAATHWPRGLTTVAPAGHNPLRNPTAYALRIALATVHALRNSTKLANPLAVYAAVPSNAASTPTCTTGCHKAAR